MTRYIYLLLGFLFTGIGLVGAYVPGLPTTIFMIIAAWFFAQSSPRFRNWIMEHPRFGKIVNNWYDKMIFPLSAKIAMVVTMMISLAVTLLITGNWVLTFGIGVCMAAVIFWATRYPSDEWEYDFRVKQGRKIGWFK